MVLTWPGTIRQDSPTEVIAAGISNKEIFAVAVAVAAEIFNCLEVFGLPAPPNRALLVIWAVGV